jgi:transposase-like protein
MVMGVAERCKTPWEMSQQLRPRWDGFLLFDEKMCSVRGDQQWFYLAVDGTGDIVHCRAVRELTVNEAIEFLEEVKELPVTIRGIVTDLDVALRAAVKVVYAGKPHQYCVKHALAAIEKLIGYKEIAGYQRSNVSLLRNEFQRLRDRKGVWVQRARQEFLQQWQVSRSVSDRYRAIKMLRDECHRVLFAKSQHQAQEHFDRLRRSRSLPQKEQRAVVAFLRRYWDHLMIHHRVRGLPRTINLVENVNKQLERRYKTIEAFQHRSTAIHYTNLLVAYLRQKQYTDCRGSRKHLNGKSRLEAAKVRHLNPLWLRNCLKPVQNSNR